MAFQTENDTASQLVAALAGAIDTDDFTLMVSSRHLQDLNADTSLLELKMTGETRIAGIASYGDGTSWYGYGTISAWADSTTGPSPAPVDDWIWRAILGTPDGLIFLEAPDDVGASWVPWSTDPIPQTPFAVANLVFGSNGREAGPHDWGTIRLWNRARDPGALLYERRSAQALSTIGLVLDKIGVGDDLDAALAAGVGTLTKSGTVTLNADLPSIIGTVPTPSGQIRPGMNAGYSTLSGYMQ